MTSLLPLLLPPLLLLGVTVGLICLPLNLLDAQVQAFLLSRFDGGAQPWLLAPLIGLPPLLLLQQRTGLGCGAGSGIPHTAVVIEEPARAPALLPLRSLLARLLLFVGASASLLPLGREGPVVFVGAAAVWALRRPLAGPLRQLGLPTLLAAAGGAGLAAGFNTPLVAVIFAAEELLQHFSARLLWTALVLALPAALVADLGGQPLFAFGVLPLALEEPRQLLLGLPIGVAGGLAGAGFSWLVLQVSARLAPAIARAPLAMGLALGGGISLLGLLTGGRALGSGAAVVADLVGRGGELSPGATALALVGRGLGPVLAMGTGLPGGLIDPALSLGGLLGQLLSRSAGVEPLLGVGLGLAAGLAGCLQLPVFASLFALRLCGDQQLLPGVVTAALVAAMTSRWLQPVPLYHGLTERFARSLAAGNPQDQRAPRL
ncbi:MAG: chloride channel protein [Synechococcus sp.]